MIRNIVTALLAVGAICIAGIAAAGQTTHAVEVILGALGR